MLRDAELLLVTYISEQTFGLIVEDQAVQEEGRLTLEEGNYSW
jgi:hypothetical protein